MTHPTRPHLSPRRIQLILIGTLIIAVGIFLLAKITHFDTAKLGRALARFDWRFLLAALFGVFIQLSFQITRLFSLFTKEHRPRWFKVAYAYTLGQTINHLMPARAGELVKIFTLRPTKTGSQTDLGVSEITGVVVADRVADVISLLSLVAIAAIINSGRFLEWFSYISLETIALTLGLAILITTVIYLIIKKRAPSALETLKNFLAGLKAIQKPSLMVPSTLCALGGRLSEMAVIYILCSAQGYPLPFDQVVFVLFILNLGISIPISIANVGVFEGAMSLALVQLNVPLEIALGIATAHHAFQLVTVGLYAGGLWLIRKFQREK